MRAQLDNSPLTCQLNIEDLPGKVALLDLRGVICAHNRRLAERLGQPGQSLVGRPLISWVRESDQLPLLQRLDSLSFEQPSTPLFELQIHSAPGQAADLSAAMSAQFDAQERLTGAFIILLDNSLRKSAERAQEAYIHSLEELYLDIERQRDELEHANEALRVARLRTEAAEELARVERLKVAFMDVAAHELRTPVTVLNGLIDCLAMELPAQTRAKLLESAGRSTGRLMSILDNALKLLSAEQPGVQGRFGLHSLGQLLADAATDVQPFVDLRSQRLVFDLPAEPPVIEMDVSMLRDVAGNLLMNAIKFTPDGGEITLSTGQSDDGSCWFAVRDTGVGIAQDDQPYIFERFFCSLDTRHHRSGSYEFGTRGPGFGLTLARKFVALHHGEITFDSPADGGTRFVVTLPRRQPADLGEPLSPASLSC